MSAPEPEAVLADRHVVACPSEDCPCFRRGQSEAQGLWFYLLAHPEDATKVAQEVLGMATYEKDVYGHFGDRVD